MDQKISMMVLMAPFFYHSQKMFVVMVLIFVYILVVFFGLDICTELTLSGTWLSVSFVSCYHFEDTSVP